MRKLLALTAAAMIAIAPAAMASGFNGGALGGQGAGFQSFSVAGGGSMGPGSSAGMDQSYASFTGTNGVVNTNNQFGTYQTSDAQTGSQFNEASSGNAGAISGGFGNVQGATGNGFGGFTGFGGFGNN